MFAPALAGMLTGLSLIVVIGAQNAYVLRQGIIRAHVGPIVAVCAASDVVLIAAGVSGVGEIIDHAGWVLDVMRWFGVTFLLTYAALSVRRATRPSALLADAVVRPSESRRGAVGRAVALTWLNPHVYLDTVLLLGSIAAAHEAGHAGGRWWFGAGAGLASIWWFSSLGFGARILAPILTRPRAGQILELVVSLTMVFVAGKLALG